MFPFVCYSNDASKYDTATAHAAVIGLDQLEEHVFETELTKESIKANIKKEYGTIAQLERAQKAGSAFSRPRKALSATNPFSQDDAKRAFLLQHHERILDTALQTVRLAQEREDAVPDQDLKSERRIDELDRMEEHMLHILAEFFAPHASIESGHAPSIGLTLRGARPQREHMATKEMQRTMQTTRHASP